MEYFNCLLQFTITAFGQNSGQGLTRFRIGPPASTYKWYGSMLVDVNESSAVRIVVAPSIQFVYISICKAATADEETAAIYNYISF